MQKIFERFPIVEIIFRTIYKFMLGTGILKHRIVPNEKATTVHKVSIKKLDELIDEMGVKHGDTLIVHSSMSGIKGFGLTADEIIDYLLNKVGNNGTLFMPTYPDFPTINSKLKYEEHYEDILVYDPDNTKAWTGYLTEVFRHRNNTVRSKYPNNSLAAMSPYNEKIFEGELSSDLAFDKNSAWNYCMETHAKVLFLGIHAHHSISEIHIAEDRMDENWPVKGWYTEKKYKIIMGDKHIEKTCRVRKSFWNKYMVEYNGCYRLRKKGLLVERKIDNICVSYVPDVYKLEKFVEERAREKDLIYFKIPRRYMK